MELKKIKGLIPYARNSKAHPEAQISRLMSVIQEYGFTQPLIVVGNDVKAGHCRLTAVQRLIEAGESIYPAPGKKGGAVAFEAGMIPTIDATGWSETQAKAYVIADNKIAESAEWLQDILALELEDIRLDDFSLDLTGFEQADLDAIFEDAAGGGENFSGDINDLFQEREATTKEEKKKSCPHCGGEL